MQRSRSFQNTLPSRRSLFLSTAPFVVALAALSPVSAQVSIGGDSTPSDPALVDGSVDLEIGVNGAGSLTILNGGTVTNATGYVGLNTTGVGVVTVSGQDSHWDNLGDVVIGQEGNGTLDILAGGFVSGESGYIGSGPPGRHRRSNGFRRRWFRQGFHLVPSAKSERWRTGEGNAQRHTGRSGRDRRTDQRWVLGGRHR
jgi:T5SS/PEP-CTERM-associated repeat protein